MKHLRHSIVVLTLCVLSLPSLQASEENFEVGLAAVDITPSYPVRLNGFGGRRKESEGIGQKLYAKCLAIRDTSGSLKLIFTVDNLGVRKSLVDKVFARLDQQNKLERNDLVLTFTHTHCAPKVDGACDTIFSQPIPPEHQKNITRYTKDLEDKLVEAGLVAIKALQPARLSWSVGKVGFAVNRRTKNGPVDHSLPVLFVESLDNHVIGVFATYACHCVTLSYNKLHGDWAGSAQVAIEKAFPKSVAMISIGLGSDSNPRTGVTGGNEAAADELGREIAAEVKRLFDQRKPIPPVTIRSDLQSIPLEFQELPSRELIESTTKQGGPAGYNASFQLAKMDAGEKLPQSIAYPVQTMQFGEQLAMVFLAGEVCVDYAIQLKKFLNSERIWLHGYANDFCAYIPSERLLKEGGYGGGAEIVYFSLPAKLKSGLETKIISEVKNQLHESFVDLSFEPDDKAKIIQPQTPEGSMRNMKLPQGLGVKLVASEPVIRDPVCIDFGFDGELWVVEMPDYAKNVDAEFEGSGSVKRLVDQDGDGYFESQTPFVTGLRFPTGVKVWKKGILICDAPDILYAEDKDGDGKADIVETWLSGFATHNPHARVNSLELGLDGWIYGSCGLFGGIIKNRKGQEFDLRGRDFRWDPESDHLEPATGKSQQGRVRDDWGHWYGCDNGTLLKYFTLPDRYVRRNPNVRPPLTQVSPLSGQSGSRLFPDGDLVLFKLSGAPGRPTSACGLGIYRDQKLGEGFNGNTFTCEPVNQLIHRRVVSYETGTAVAQRATAELESEFMTSKDNWFRPVQVKTGPDGALWVVDMYRYVIEHPRWIPESTKKDLDVFAGTRLGRIYRIAPESLTSASTPLPKATDEQLIRLATGTNGTIRDLVVQWLVWKRRMDLLPKLSEQAAHSTPAARATIISVYHQMNSLRPDFLVKQLRDPAPLVRQFALRVAEEHLDQPAVLREVLGAVKDEHPLVRKQAFYALAGADSPQAHELLISKWSESQSIPEIRYAVLSSIVGDARTPWRKFLYHQLSQPVSIEFLDEELLESVLAGVHHDDWCGLFSSMFSKAAKTSELFDDSRFIALANHMPSKITRDDVRRELGQLVQIALDLIRRQQIDEAKLPRVLQATWHCAQLTNVDLPAIELLTPDLPTSYQSKIVLHAVDHMPQSWDKLIKVLNEGLPKSKSVAVDRWLQTSKGRSFMLKQARENKVFRTWVNNEQKTRWLESETEPNQRLLRSLFDIEKRMEANLIVKKYMDGQPNQGNPTKGFQVFQKHCSACHQLGGVGHALGPDLAAITNRNKKYLLYSILDPSADIDARYQSVVIEVESGQQYSGLVLDETSNGIVLQIDKQKTKHVLRKEIERVRTDNKSFMPTGFEKEINPQQMNDLLVFLTSKNLQRKTFEGNVPETIVIKRGANPLPAKHAEIYGQEIRFERPFQNIGYWHHQDDHIVWNLVVKDPGTYRLEIEYACADQSQGNRAVLVTRGNELDCQVAGTGGWSEYKKLTVGEVKLNAGKEQLVIRPDGAVRGALMDLKGVRLVYLQE